MTDPRAFPSYFANQRASDPTRTLTLTRRWIADWNRRVKALQRAIWVTVVDNDALGLVDQKRENPMQVHQQLTPGTVGKWAYRWSPEKITGFMDWLRSQEEMGLLEVVTRPGTLRPEGEPWSNIYVRSSYQKGLAMARAEVNRNGGELARLLGLDSGILPPSFTSTDSYISAIMQQPFHADRLALAYTRTFDELKGVTATMNQQISRELTSGIAKGLNPREMGANIADRVEKIGATRGRLIARTETIHVHQQAALNEYYAIEKATGQVILAEWNATMDSRTRDTHAERNGRVYLKEEAYGLIGEPNCRCAILPYIPVTQGTPRKATEAARAAAKRAILDFKKTGKRAQEMEEEK